MKKKLLIVSPAVPYPLSSGADIAQHFFLNLLSKDLEIVFCTKVYDTIHKEKFFNYKYQNTNIKFYYYDASLSKFSRLNFKIRVYNLFNRLFGVSNNKSLKEKKYKPYNNEIDIEFGSFVNELIKKENPDFLQIEFLNYANLAQIISEKISKIFVHHEIWYKAVFHRNKKTVFYSDEEMQRLKDDEIRLLSFYDKIIVFNDNDKSILEKELKDKEIIISPFGIPEELIKKNKVSKSYKNLLFIGGEVHFANKQGLEWFLNDIYIPNISNIDYNIIIIGNWSKETISKYKALTKVVFLGFVDDIENYYNESVLLVPIISGSGLRSKIINAFANKIPVISTGFGAEGLFNSINGCDYFLKFENENDFLIILKKISQKEINLSEIALRGYDFYYSFSRKLKYIRMSIYEKDY